MTRFENAASRCRLPWCTTDHGRTRHPDDEAHRSAGVAVIARLRDDGATGDGHQSEVEVGLLRRPGDDQTWLVVEDGDSVHLEVTVTSALRILRTVIGDSGIRAVQDD